MITTQINCGGQSWTAVAERGGDTAVGRTENSRIEKHLRAHESGVALRLPPQSKMLAWFAILLGSLFAVFQVSAATLQIQITPKVSGENLQPASLRYQTSAGETFSITRVSYLANEFALQRNDGSSRDFVPHPAKRRN